MVEPHLRSMRPDEWDDVADLICISTNYWYQVRGFPPIFGAGPEATRLFCEVYESLDPGCCLLAQHPRTGRLMGSCFYHPRETHVSLGIMNVHPNYFRAKVARRLLDWIVQFAAGEGRSVRLVSSAMNLDSFSLYTRAGFVPRQTFQDMYLAIPEQGIPEQLERSAEVRPATCDDIPAMARLELEVAGIRREKDYRYFIENPGGYWHISVLDSGRGDLDAFLVSIVHPGSTMIGPGVARTQQDAAALLLAELNVRRGCTPVFLLPVDCDQLVQKAYQWGARNCELHVAQIYGAFQPYRGVVMPTFMPETG